VAAPVQTLNLETPEEDHLLRKTFIAAGAATLAVGVAGIAYAQTPPSITATASLSPSKAGTKAKPKSEKLTLSVTNDPASKTTAKSITITIPSTLKLSTKGLKQCTKSDDAILAAPTTACRGSIAGSGTASALLNPNSPSPAPLSFKVTPIVGKNQLLFYLEQSGGAVKAVLHGKISGKKLTIAIPDFLQQPAPGTYSALNGLKTTLSLKKGTNYLLSSTGCKSKKQPIGVTVAYAPNPNPPAAPSASTTANAKCS
jgi:hypothetical protein